MSLDFNNYPVGYEFWFKDCHGRVGTGILESFTWDMYKPHLRITAKWCSTEFIAIAFMDEPYKFYYKQHYEELCVKFNKEFQKIETAKMLEKKIKAKEEARKRPCKYGYIAVTDMNCATIPINVRGIMRLEPHIHRADNDKMTTFIVFLDGTNLWVNETREEIQTMINEII